MVQVMESGRLELALPTMNDSPLLRDEGDTAKGELVAELVHATVTSLRRRAKSLQMFGPCWFKLSPQKEFDLYVKEIVSIGLSQTAKGGERSSQATLSTVSQVIATEATH